ncbi:tetrathionate reductase family octaheme c-type cytochrome [candidate division KSB1 bacterium]|nr:tetrathionate reductase family octaheme c-type cytochrome [candidate division KSB1 bacterium]
MNFRNTWITLFILIVLVLLVPIIYFLPKENNNNDPWAYVPKRLPHTDHSSLMTETYESGQAVTKKCRECHEESAHQIMQSSHWTWESPPVQLVGRPEPVVLGKKNALNNFCIGIQSNWPACTACHAGYGWTDASYDFSIEENVDCLVCHDRSGQYVKIQGGLPAPDVDLLTAAKSVGEPTRENCGGCHFKGGGGNAVKHGDLDGSLYYPSERIDVHMGKHNFSCTDCHQSEQHQMKGRAISVSMDDENQVYCTDCHDAQLHDDERLNNHVASVACQTCHIPVAAVKEATKMHWDWSAAGQDLPEDPHEYLKIKGRFIYEKDITPDYFWYDGTAQHYIMGDKIDADKVTMINEPNGDIKNVSATIWPFKIHTAKQIYDTRYKYLLQPKTYGEGGYWTEFDWDQAIRLGSEATGLAYSGNYNFTSTAMFWPLTHMVSPTENALQCIDCHTKEGKARMNWEALGYEGDPMVVGGRKRIEL